MNRVPIIKSICEDAINERPPAAIEAANRQLNVDLGEWTDLHITLMAMHSDGRLSNEELADLCHYLGMDEVQFNSQSAAVKFTVMRFTTGDLLLQADAA